MADTDNEEIGLNIPISAYADEDSAKKAVQDLTKNILGALKDGYIEIPTAISDEFDKSKASAKLIRAQKDFISQWEKMSKEGFSSSEEDLQNFVNKFTEFKRLMGKEGKAGSKQNLAIRDLGLNDLIQSYRKQLSSIQTEVTKQTRTTRRTTRNSTMTTKEKRKQEEAIQAAIDKKYGYDKLSKELKKGVGHARAATPGSPINLGLRKPNLEGPYVDEKTLRMSEISPYRNMDEARRAKELQEIRARERASLTSRRATTEDIIKADEKVNQREASGMLQSGTEYQLIKRALLTELAKIQGGLIKGKPDATSQKLIDQVLANLAYDEEQGIDPLKSITSINNVLQKRYDTRGSIGVTDGSIKGEGPNQKETNETLKQIYKILGQFIEARQTIADNVRNIRDTLSDKTSSNNSLYARELNRITNSDQMQAIRDALGPTNGLLTRSLSLDTRETVREKTADDAAGRASRTSNEIATDTLKIVDNDASTGFNTDAKADELISLVKNILSILTGGQFSNNADSGILNNNNLNLREKFKLLRNSTDLGYDQIQKILADEANKIKASNKNRQSEIRALPGVSDGSINPPSPPMLTRESNNNENYVRQVEKSRIYATPLRQGFFKSIEDAFNSLIGTTRRYEKVLKANADEQDEMAAERIRIYGLNNGRNPNDTGDIAGMRRILQLYRTNKASIESNPELAQRIQLTPGREVNTTEITEALNRALSGKNMRNAQMGGSIPRQILGAFTGYIGMPSIEKSRAQAEGLNQILGNVNDALQSVLINIQTKETELAGMEASGQARFDSEGYLTPDSTSAAFKTLADLEEEKLVLDSIKADLLANDKIIKQTGGRFSSLVKNLSFTSPVLKENNGILRNINAGLDKNGKALKFQTRLAEILNYSFQLMSRHIGQILKNWLWMINPLNLIKKAFDDFASYDPKWQRTLNVIKYNLRDVIRPFMEWIAQTLVNIIGFLDIISMKIQEAFGYTPISLFDQENADEMKKTYEEIQSISASFDELHDIGSTSSENDPDNLLGEIYKPQLSQGWIDLANEIGDLFAGLITGDLGFGDVMARILEIAWDGIKQIWEWFKNTEVGQWLIENWKSILATILKLFLGWQLLKIAGSALFNALFGKLTSGAITSVFSKVGGWITSFLGSSGFGQGILMAFQTLFASGKYSLIGTLKEMFTNSAAITQAGSWGSMIGFALVKGLVGTLSIALGTKGLMDAFDSSADKASYNIGLMNSGGNEENKQSNGWDIVKGAASGAAIGFGVGQIIPVVGPAIGAIIGGVAGALTTSLAPAFEEVEVASKNANNEMQKMEYYEGVVQGISTEVDEFSEILDLSNQALESQTNKVYSLGEEYGISQTRLDKLVQSVKEGTYNTDMLTGSETNLSGALDQLSWHYTNNADLTDKLTEAKKKLQKAEMDLAIAQDIEAGNFELAAARVEVAYASNVYDIDEATKKMTQIIKQGSAEQRSDILQNMSPELKENWNDYYTTTDEGVNEISKLYDNLKESEREAFLQDLDPEIRKMLEERNKVIEEEVNKHPLLKLFDIGNDGKIFGISYIGDIPGYATGTNYVQSDGLAYLHRGEAVIPKKYNQPYQPGTMSNEERAYMNQMINTMRSLDNTLSQGISVNGQFVQRGSDLVAVVNKTNLRTGADLLSNVAYAR